MSSAPEIPPWSAWLQHGQSLEAAGRFDEALAVYEQAIAASAAHGDVRTQGLAWMNCGNALQQRERAANRPAASTDAVTAYDRAIELFGRLPIADDPRLRNHLGAAWLNRGHALLQGEQLDAALDSFKQAIAQLEQLPPDADPYFRLNLAGAHVNVAHTLLAFRDSDVHRLVESRAAAHDALALLRDVEQAHAAFAEMSLRARRALVMSLGQLLGFGGNPPSVLPGAPAQSSMRGDFLAEATDAIDDGLALARHWETRGMAALRPLAVRLFRLGTQIYRQEQPHFLAEFVLENLEHEAFAGDADFRATAADAITIALADVRRPHLFVAGTPQAARLLSTAQSLREAEQRLLSLSPTPAT